MKEKNYIEAKVKFNRYMYPKSGHKDGDFAIVSVYVVEEISGKMSTDLIWHTAIIKGTIPKMQKDVEYKLKAEEVYNEQYRSYQYDVKYIGVPCEMSDSNGRETFLRSILTDKQVDSLYKEFENPLEIIMNEDIKSLCKVSGIKEKTANDIINKVISNLDYSTAFIELEKYEMTNSMIKKLVDKYGSPDIVVSKIKENPYLLVTDIDGIGFKKADMIALQGGMPFNSIKRYESFIIYYLTEEAISGKSYVPQREVMGKIVEVLEVDVSDKLSMDNLKKAIYSLNSQDILWWDENKTCLALTKYKNMEYQIAREIERLSNSAYKFPYKDWEEVISEIETEQGWSYTDEQKEGVKTTLDNNVVVITGLAGTGKTTVTKAMTKILKENAISQCALSGRASQRISENTGMEAHTIHRLLKFTKTGFEHNSSNPLDSDIIIFDEASMPSLELVLALLKAIKTGAKLVIIGDYGQLSSIGAGNFFMDLLQSGVVPVVKLTEVHRQAQASAIISKSIDIRHQIQLFDYNFAGDAILGELQDLEICIREIKEELPNLLIRKFDEEYTNVGSDINKVQIIVPTRERGELCCAKLNKIIQQKYNMTAQEVALYEKDMFNKLEGVESEEDKKLIYKEFYAKIEDKALLVKGKYKYKLALLDKVIITKNNKKVSDTEGNQVNIFNGNLGTVLEVDGKNRSIIVDINGVGEVVITNEFLATVELAYAITCHKLQGSSAERVIIGLDYSSYMLLSCEWLYTAITRAEKKATLVGENKAVRTAISTRETNDKLTFLPYALKKISF